MIIQHTADNRNVLFNPEDVKERKALEALPGLLKQGLYFYCPNKQNIVYSLYYRLKRKVKNIKFTPAVKEMVEGEFPIKEIPPDFKFHTKPLKHQLIALRFAYTFVSFLNLSEPGLGKTKVTLDYIWLMQFKKSLIVCPKSLRFVWEEETLKHRPELSVYVIQSTDWSAEKDRVEAADLVVVNYDKAVDLEKALEGLKFAFIAVDEGLIKNPSTERTKSLTRLSEGIEYRCVMSGTLVNNSPLDVFAPLRFVEPSLVGKAFGKFRDEYALVSRHNRFITVGYRNVAEVKDTLASCSIIMTKAEWLKDLPPKTFHRRYVQMGDQQRDYYQKLASNYLLQLESGDEIEVDNPLSVLIKLNQISNGFVYYKENIEETINDLYGTESKSRAKANRKTFFFKEQPKADALIRLIHSQDFNNPTNSQKIGSEVRGGNGSAEMGESTTSTYTVQHLRTDVESDQEPGDYDRVNGISSNSRESLGSSSNGSTETNRPDNGQARRAIIWFNLSAELDIIERVLRENNLPYTVIKGGEKNVGFKVRQFNKDPSIRFLICQAKTINYGVTIMGTSEEDLDVEVIPEFDSLVSDQIFYSINFSLEVFLQQQDRIHRIGQTRECHYWLLLTNSKIERTIADRLEEKLLCNKEILVDIIENLNDRMLVD
jgi:SNF2 family DNA or RNA helicase